LVFAGMKRSLLLLQPNHCQMTTTTWSSSRCCFTSSPVYSLVLCHQQTYVL
jgi:hypothetical protein